MTKHGTIRRYFLEIEKINSNQFPSFKEIKDFLSDHGIDVSGRTMQRDIEQIRFEFGVEIQYNRDKNGYYIDYENSINIESFFRFLEIVNTAELLTESLIDSKDLLKYISFDKGGGLKGVENLKPILKAIKSNRKISFSHYNFQTNEDSLHVVNPYLLKEYQNRWYVFGQLDSSDKFRTFGIDRIDCLEIKTETFKPNNDINLLEIFYHTIGLVYSKNKIENVILSFTPMQGKYVKTLPLHTSQTIIVDNDKELRVSIDVIPNYELTQLILKYGDTVKVIEPKWLIKQIMENLQRTIEKYK